MIAIDSSDVIFATLSLRGCVKASLRISGITSFADILCRLRSCVAGIAGVVTIDLRNGTQGWQQRRTVLLPSSMG